MKIKLIIASLMGAFALSGCSTGDLRAFNDGLSEANGYNVSYPDQREVNYTGDVK